MAKRRPLVFLGGNVSELPSGDAVSASLIANTPDGNIAATDVQAAINELDTEKLPNTTSLTEIGAALADDDEVPVYDTSASANRKSLLSRIWTYISDKLASPPAIGGTTPAAGNFTTLGATGNVTLGDASGDTVTINGTAVSIPNNLNIDSGTLYLNASADRVGIGSVSPSAKVHVVGGTTSGTSFDTLILTGGAVNATGSGAKLYLSGAPTAPLTRTTYIEGINTTGATNGHDLVFATSSGSSSPVERLRIDNVGNVGIGTSTLGASATKTLGLATGAAPTTGPADTIQLYSTDLSAGNTMLSLYTEGTCVNANATAAATHRIAVRINGTVYYLLANTAA